MDEYKPNSRRSKETAAEAPFERRVDGVTVGEVKLRKKTWLRKFADTVISEDVVNVKSYILRDVLLPLLRNAVSDIVVNSTKMILFGESDRSRKAPHSTRDSYRSYYDTENERRHRYEPSTRIGLEYDDVLFETRGDAESVLDAMHEILASYGVVCIGDFYDLAKISTRNYVVANRYGWTDISNASVSYAGNGWIIKLPRALPIK